MSLTSNKWKLATSIAIPVIGGSVFGLLATRYAKKKYSKLEKPSFSPPSWAFPVAWTSLYTTMGIAKHQFNKQPKSVRLQKSGDIAYATQLGLNFLWSFLFFRWNLRGTAFIEAALLWSAVTLTTYYFYQANGLAGSLMTPYIGWVTFALGLNAATWKLNNE